MRTIGELYVFEGPDSVGKTSLSRMLATELRSRKLDCLILSFPGKEQGTLGKLIYELHHAPQTYGVKKFTPAARQLLHVAAHVDAVESRILPALRSGRTVILDRFWWSTYVYGRLSGLSIDLLDSIVGPERHVWNNIAPTSVFLIERSTPIEFQATASWDQCMRLYSELASTQAIKQTVQRIKNEKTIEDALNQILRAIEHPEP